MAAESIRARFDRRADLGAPRLALVWPALAGCALWLLDPMVHALVSSNDHHARAPGVSLFLLFGLAPWAPWAPWAMLLALSERPPLRCRALLANGCFLLLTTAICAAAL
jgi:hypothetical protein